MSNNSKLLADAAAKILKRDFEGITFERLLCRPMDALKFCRVMRREFGAVAEMPTEPLLWSILNVRKHGSLRLEDIGNAR